MCLAILFKTWPVLLQYICVLVREGSKLNSHAKGKECPFLYFLRNMESAFTQCFPSEFVCSICKDNFTDPVTISCGHRFCAPCLCLLWEDVQTAPCCPVCKAVSPKMDFKSTIFAKEHVLPTRGSVVCQLPSSAKQMCRIHQVIKLYFCQTDKSLLCLFCSHSPEHATHEHYPVKQVAEHYRVSDISECL